ncbi:MAG: efflux RND transporter periplasmic adaptor subunit [Candidatus Scalindua sp.]|nr:efflux RND transporter periplasmic adaptor subunit [Candidatus Scalindua sp.]
MKSVIIIRACLIFLFLASTAFFALKSDFLWKRKADNHFNSLNKDKKLSNRSDSASNKENQKKQNVSQESSTSDRKSSEAVPVEITRVIKSDVEIFLSNNCTLEPAKQVDVVAQISGFIKEVLVEEGDSVESGKLLARLNEAEAILALKDAKAKKENAQRIYMWSLDNFKENLVSRDEVEDNKFKFEIASVELEKRQLEYEYTTIESPIAGVIVEKAIEVGYNVKKDQIVFKIADFDPILARIYIPEKDLNKIEVGQTARIVSEFFTGIEFMGKVKEISPVVDRESGTVKVTLEIADTSNILRPGMFVSVYVIVGRHYDALVIPKKALLLGSEADEVFVVKDFFVMDVAHSALSGLDIGDRVECTQSAIPAENSPDNTDSVVEGKVVNIFRHNMSTLFSITIEISDSSKIKKEKFDRISLYGKQDVQLCKIEDVVFSLEQRAMKTKVSLGFSAEQNIEILAGLKEGDRVITAGQNDIGQGAGVIIVHEKNGLSEIIQQKKL